LKSTLLCYWLVQIMLLARPGWESVMFIFQIKDIFFQSLHPASILIYPAIIVAGAVALNHPFFLLVLFMAIFSSLAVSGGLGAWLKSVRFFFVLISLFFVINTLANRMGSTVLLQGPVLPVFGCLTVTLENLVFVLTMGIRLLIVFTAFIFYNYTLNPDRALSFFARFFPRSALLVALTTKSIPYLSQKLQSVAEIAQCRGVNFHTGSRLTRIKNLLPLIRVLFISALEDSFNIGESIQARAYGSGPRTNYTRERFRPGDFLVTAASVAALLLIMLSLIRGWGHFSFYPRLGSWVLARHQVWTLLGTWLLLMIPALLAWGWNKWNFIR